jgi:hypothetical protein
MSLVEETIHVVSKPDFLGLVYDDTDSFIESIENKHAYVVQQFYDREQILDFRAFLERFRNAHEASWHPCLDGVPDYHRINDEYPKSWVKTRMHSYYFHRWNEHRDIFDSFKEIFELKNYLAGEDGNAYYDNIPSDGVVSRVVSHQYPRGGGYLAEHIDPVNPFATIQTIIQASEPGVDFATGGLYMRDGEQAEAVLIDPYTAPGDLMVLSPGVRHGVALVDPDDERDWERSDGRWMILPVVIRSDYNMDPETKPKSV